MSLPLFLPEWGSWCSKAGLSCGITPVPICSQLLFPPSTDLPINFLQSAKPPSLPLFLMCSRGSTPHVDHHISVRNWDSRWSLCYRPTSTPVLPLRFVQVISQSFLPCLSPSPSPIKVAFLLLCSIPWIYPHSHLATSGVWFTHSSCVLVVLVSS